MPPRIPIPAPIRIANTSSARHAHTQKSHYHRSLRGLRCLITGGSRGIGKAIAQRFSQLDAQITLVGRDASRLRAALQDMAPPASSASGDGSVAPHACVAGDVGSRDFWEQLVRAPQRACEAADAAPLDFVPGVDVLVNAAGVTHNALLVRQNPDAVEHVVRTNLMGTVWASKVVGKAMLSERLKREKRGEKKIGPSIINVSSLLALQGGVGSAAYAASKAGVLGLTRALAAELGPSGVRVNAIVPGYIETDMTAAMHPDEREKALKRIPLKRFGDVDEIADAAVFLATNHYANNCVVNLDGGMSAV